MELDPFSPLSVSSNVFSFQQRFGPGLVNVLKLRRRVCSERKPEILASAVSGNPCQGIGQKSASDLLNVCLDISKSQKGPTSDFLVAR